MGPLVNENNIQSQKFNFEHAIRPVFYSTRIAGLWPFSIVRDSNGNIQRARVALSDILWSILFICFHLTLLFYTFKKVKTAQVKIENQLRFIVLSVFLISSLLVGIFGIIFDMINRHLLVNILRKFNLFDNEVRLSFICLFQIQSKPKFRNFLLQKQISRFGVYFNYHRDNLVCWVYLLIPTSIALLLMTILVSVFLRANSFEFIRCTSVNCLHFAMWISIEVSFIIFMRSLCERFAALNSLLRCFSRSISCLCFIRFSITKI